MELPCGNSCMRLAQRKDGRDRRGEPRGTRCGRSLVDSRWTSRPEPELKEQTGESSFLTLGSRGRVNEDMPQGTQQAGGPAWQGNLSSQLAFPVSLSSAQSCLWRVSGAARRGHGACTARCRFQHRPARSLLIFLMQTLSPLLMNSLSLCPCGNFHQLAPSQVCMCVCVHARACAQNQRGPWCAGQPCPLCKALDSAWKPQLVSDLC